jgi:hypothetical protein
MRRKPYESVECEEVCARGWINQSAQLCFPRCGSYTTRAYETMRAKVVSDYKATECDQY